MIFSRFGKLVLRSLHHKWGSGEFSPTEIRSSADKMRSSLLEASMARTSIGAFRHLYRIKGSKTSRNILNKENIEWVRKFVVKYFIYHLS